MFGTFERALNASFKLIAEVLTANERAIAKSNTILFHLKRAFKMKQNRGRLSLAIVSKEIAEGFLLVSEHRRG